MTRLSTPCLDYDAVKWNGEKYDPDNVRARALPVMATLKRVEQALALRPAFLRWLAGSAARKGLDDTGNHPANECGDVASAHFEGTSIGP